MRVGSRLQEMLSAVMMVVPSLFNAYTHTHVHTHSTCTHTRTRTHTYTHTHTQDQQKHKIGFFDVLNAKAEIDYTSQMNKDISKRRKHLFRVIWANGAHDLFQASTEIQRNHW